MKKIFKRRNAFGKIGKKLLGAALSIPMVFTLIPGQIVLADSTNATEITLDNKVTGNLESSSDDDWYTFTTENYCAYYNINAKNVNIIDSVMNGGFKCVVYDEDKSAVDTFFVSEGSQAEHYVKLAPGSKAYLEICTDTINSGDYYFTVSAEADASDDVKNAQVLKYGTSYNESFRTSSDADYYVLNTASYAATYSFDIKNISIADALFGDSLSADIYDEDMALVYAFNRKEAVESTDTVKLNANSTYYLKFCTDTVYTGDYKFTVTTKKEDGDTKKAASSARVNKKYTKYIDKCSEGDVDWMVYKVAKTGTYKISLKNVDINSQMTALIYSNSKKAETLTVNCAASTSGKLNLKKGAKLYIKVSSLNGSTGKYTVKITK